MNRVKTITHVLNVGWANFQSIAVSEKQYMGFFEISLKFMSLFVFKKKAEKGPKVDGRPLAGSASVVSSGSTRFASGDGPQVRVANQFNDALRFDGEGNESDGDDEVCA